MHSSGDKLMSSQQLDANRYHRRLRRHSFIKIRTRGRRSSRLCRSFEKLQQVREKIFFLHLDTGELWRPRGWGDKWISRRRVKYATFWFGKIYHLSWCTSNSANFKTHQLANKAAAEYSKTPFQFGIQGIIFLIFSRFYLVIWTNIQDWQVFEGRFSAAIFCHQHHLLDFLLDSQPKTLDAMKFTRLEIKLGEILFKASRNKSL